MHIALITVAAGSGARFRASDAGGRFLPGCDKLWLELGGEPLFIRSLRNLGPVCTPGCVIIAVAPSRIAEFGEAVKNAELPFEVKIVAGGECRAQSVANALAALELEDGIVGIHDAARPLADAELFSALCRAAQEEHPCGVIPASRAADTLKVITPDGFVAGDADRNLTVLVGTPQVFPVKELWQAQSFAGKNVFTDDAGLFLAAGYRVKILFSDRPNVKITHPGDWELIKKLAEN